MVFEGFPVTVGVNPSFFLCYTGCVEILEHLMTLTKYPQNKPFSVCEKCGKIYTSWLSSAAHSMGQCEHVNDARDLFDFSEFLKMYTVLFTCQRGRRGNFRTVEAESAEAARIQVELSTPTLAEVYEVRPYVR